MDDREVVIDGISLLFPKNDFSEYAAFIRWRTDKLAAWQDFSRRVDLATFDIGNDIAVFDDALKLFMESARP